MAVGEQDPERQGPAKVPGQDRFTRAAVGVRGIALGLDVASAGLDLNAEDPVTAVAAIRVLARVLYAVANWLGGPRRG